LNAQIKKGVLEMCLLYKLSQKDYYGYHLMKEMRVLFPEVNDSTFYAILRRLGKEGAAAVYYGEESGGPKRKYYNITERGLETLQSQICDWEQLKEIVKKLGI
jgi:PadR family transcriptional regulator PadR